MYSLFVCVPVDDAEGEKKAGAEEGAHDTEAGGDGPTHASTAPARKSMKLSYEDYRTMANLLMCHMRCVEEQATQGKWKGVLGVFVVTVDLELVLGVEIEGLTIEFQVFTVWYGIE